MATSDLNKEYLEYTKKEASKWHFYLGGDPVVRRHLKDNVFDWGTDVNLLYKIQDKDVHFVTNRLDWTLRLAATPWNPNTESDDKTLIFNPVNSIAYLCVSDNELNRSDFSIRGKNPSIYIPSHTNGLLSYEDGYSWYALFVVDPGKLDIVTSSKIPVMSLNDFSENVTNTALTQSYSQICGAGYTAEGTCCLYAKEISKDALGITVGVGDLTYVKVTTSCYRCTELAKKLNAEYVFKTGITSFPPYPTCTPCDCSIQIEDKITQIEKRLGELNPSGFYRHIYANYQGWENPSEILSVFIDLENLTDDEKTIPIANPKVNFESITGTDAQAELITEYIGENKNRVTGIRLLERGKNYKNGDTNPKIEGVTGSILEDYIEINVAPEDFPENPVSMLNSLETCIRVSITNKMVEDTNTNLRTFTRYGIMKDVRLEADNTKASDGLNSNEFQMLRATTVATLGLTAVNVPVD
jgi:hypothetical protein